jgi:hypothetical protein
MYSSVHFCNFFLDLFVGVGALIVEKLLINDAFSTNGATMSKIIKEVIEKSPDILSLSVCDFCERQDKAKARFKRKKDNYSDVSTKKEELQVNMIDVLKRLLASNLYPLCSLCVNFSHSSGALAVEGILVPSGPTHALIYCDFLQIFSVRSLLSTNYLNLVSLQSSCSVGGKTGLCAQSLKENGENYVSKELCLTNHGQPSMLSRIRSGEPAGLPSLFSLPPCSTASSETVTITNPHSSMKSTDGVLENSQSHRMLRADSVGLGDAPFRPFSYREGIYDVSSANGCFASDTRYSATNLIEDQESLIFFDAVDKKDDLLRTDCVSLTDPNMQKQFCASPIREETSCSQGVSRPSGFIPVLLNNLFSMGEKVGSLLRSPFRTVQESEEISAEIALAVVRERNRTVDDICNEESSITKSDDVPVAPDRALTDGIDENPLLVYDCAAVAEIITMEEEDTVIDLDHADEGRYPHTASESSGLIVRVDECQTSTMCYNSNERVNSTDARIRVIEDYFEKVKDLSPGFRRNLFYCLVSGNSSIIDCGHEIFNEIKITGAAEKQVKQRSHTDLDCFLRRSLSISKLIKKLLKVKISSNPVVIDFICLLSLLSVIININCLNYYCTESEGKMTKSAAKVFQDNFEVYIHSSLQRMALALGSPFFAPSTMSRLLGDIALSAEVTALSPGSVVSFLRSHYGHLGVYRYFEPVFDVYDEKKRLDVISPEKSMIPFVQSSSPLSVNIIDENRFELKRSNSDTSFSSLASDPLAKKFFREAINVDSLLAVPSSSLLQKSVIGHRKNVGIKRSVSLVSNQISRVPSVGNAESVSAFPTPRSSLTHNSNKRMFTDGLTNPIQVALSPFPSKKAKLKHSFLSPSPSFNCGSVVSMITSVPIFGNDSFLSPEKVLKK